MTRGEGAAVGMTGDAGAAFRMTELTYFSSLKRFVCHISREPSNQSGLGEESIDEKYRYSCAYIRRKDFCEPRRRARTGTGRWRTPVVWYNYNPRTAWSPEERLADMDSLGVDVHVLSTNAYFYNYDKDARDDCEHVS